MKKILFNDQFGLTEAVLEGRKTMTRRIIPADIAEKLIIQGDEFFPTIPCVGLKSRFKIGEVVAVAQNYCTVRHNRNLKQDVDAFLVNHCEEAGWTNKMFVRADLMPHQIRITDIRIERLQDISDEDCIKEGIWYDFPFGWTYDGLYHFYTPQEAFAALIDKVSGKGTWDSNPFVFAYSFELEK